MKNTLTALALLTAVVAPSFGNAAVCGGPVCPAPRPVCNPCQPTCAPVCMEPACVVKYCCPKILGFANGGNRPGYWGASCNPCCN